MEEEEYIPVEAAKYEPVKEWRSVHWNMGFKVSPERAERIASYKIDLEDLTLGDVVSSLNSAAAANFWFLIGIIKKRWGDEAAADVCKEYAYEFGKILWKSWCEKFGVKEMNIEQITIVEDLAHALLGPDMKCHFEYKWPNTTIGTRQSCLYYSNAPPELKEYCKYCCEGFRKAYTELQPSLKMEQPKKLPDGDGECVLIFEVKK